MGRRKTSEAEARKSGAGKDSASTPSKPRLRSRKTKARAKSPDQVKAPPEDDPDSSLPQEIEVVGRASGDQPKSSESAHAAPNTLSEMDQAEDTCKKLAYMVARGEHIGIAADRLEIPDEKLIEFVQRPYWTELVKSFVMTTEEVSLEYDKLVPVALDIKKRALKDPSLGLEEKNKVASEVLKSRGLSSMPRESKRRMKITEVAYLRMSVAEMTADGSAE